MFLSQALDLFAAYHATNRNAYRWWR